MTQVVFFYTNAAGSWPDPGNWNPAANKIECMGGGGQGMNGNPGLGVGGAGGGGGAYAGVSNRALTFPVSYRTGTGGRAAGSPEATNFGSTSLNYDAAAICSAESGTYGSFGTGGKQFKPAGFAGGDGGPQNSSGFFGAGGAGAAGPNGVGQNGYPASGTVHGRGGSADGGTVPVTMTAGAGGASGTEFGSYGCGAGGAGGSGSTPGGGGGYYGGGGAGGGTGGSGTAGTGTQGLIIITYTPLVVTPPHPPLLLEYGLPLK